MEKPESIELLPWHRIFGISLSDYFTGTLYRVELEKDLSIKQQFLDVVIIEAGEGKIPDELPDGLENLAAHNLLTYKSHQEALNGWTLYELSGHYVNYRKQVSPSLKVLLPEKDFQLYAVSTRYPAELMKNADFIHVKPGIYDIKCPWDSRNIRLIVLSRISKEKKNAIWHLFSAKKELVEYGASEYQWHSPVSSIVNSLFIKYNMEGVIAMPYTIQDYQNYMRDCVFNYLDTLTPGQVEKFMKGIPVDKILKGVPVDERLKGVPVDERLKGISIDELLEKIPVEKLMEKIKSKGLKNNN